MNKSRERINKVKDALRNPWAWPGGYPIQFFTYDGCLCHHCVRANWRAVVADTKMNAGGWCVQPEVLWEGSEQCVECGNELESAYGDPELEPFAFEE